MPNVNPNDLFSCTNGCYMTGEGPGAQLALNDYWIQVSSLTGGPFTYQMLANGLATYWSTIYAPLITSAASFVGSSVRWFGFSTPASFDRTGTITADSGVAQVVMSTGQPFAAPGYLICITGASNPVYNGVWRIRQMLPSGVLIGSRKFDGQPPATGFSWQTYLDRPAPTYSNIAAVAGTGGGVPCPLQSCGLLSMTNGLSGRRGLNRWYFPFPSTNSCFTTGPTTDYVNALTNTVGAALLGIQTITVTGGGINVQFGYLPISSNAGITALQPYQGAAGKKRWATQRRRGQFGKVNQNPWGNM